MFRMGIKLFLAISAMRAMAQYEGDTCKLKSNDFERTKCGEGAKKKCCKLYEACLTVKVKEGTDWKDTYECSKARSLYGTKTVKIIIIPAILCITDIVFAAYMVMRLNLKGNIITKLGLVVISLSWPLFLSEKWIYGLYCSILAVFVSFVSESLNKATYPFYIYRLAWALVAFQVVLLLGPTETFHVPIFNQSLAGKSTELFTSFSKITPASCNVYFESFFKLTATELKAKGVDPDDGSHGVCKIGYLAFVQTVLVVQAILWFVVLLVSAPVFLNGIPFAQGSSAAVAIKPKTDDPTEDANVVQVIPAGEATPEKAEKPSSDPVVEVITEP